jgi:multiple sugar transport system substrate-binding protein
VEQPTASFPGLDRRSLLKGMGLLGAAAAIPGLAACADTGTATPESKKSAGKASGTVRFGLNANAAVPTAGYDSVFAAFEQKTGIKVRTNKLLYTEQINNYLTAAPDDVLIWNAGYRMRFFAEKQLVSDVTSVWDQVGSNISEAVKQACTAKDGKQYLVPFYNYPWVTYYRKSVFEKRGYAVPKTLDELTTLASQMKRDGLTPIAFADKEGWEAMGTFDILNMRVNGYDFHIQLLDGKESWDDDRVKSTFDTWRRLLPIHQPQALGRTWQEAAQALGQEKAGMYFMGSFAVDQFDDATKEDLDFFPFPEIDSEHGQDAIDAPIDGFMMVKRPDNAAASQSLLEYLASAEAAELYLKTDTNDVATAQNVDTSNYTVLQKKYADVIGSSKNVAQYLDRDTRPDFAAPVVLPAIQDFLKGNGADIDGITRSLQSQAKSIFAS